jgi:heat shock protein HslJ
MMNKFLASLIIIWLASCSPSSHSGKKENTNHQISQNEMSEKDSTQNQMDFKATGNEPFWLLEIDFDNSMHFKTLNGIDITTNISKGEKAMDADVTRYVGQTDTSELIVQIFNQECIDDMSGKKSDFGVTINYKKNKEDDYENYKGCGNYLANERLNAKWELESINSKPINKEDFNLKIPVLQFDLSEKRVSGNAGCNSFSGPIELLGKSIKFGNLISTKMACQDMKFENEFFKGITNRTIPYSVTSGKLQFQFSPDSVFVYKKVE